MGWLALVKKRVVCMDLGAGSHQLTRPTVVRTSCNLTRVKVAVLYLNLKC